MIRIRVAVAVTTVDSVDSLGVNVELAVLLLRDTRRQDRFQSASTPDFTGEAQELHRSIL
jgi:hypothetical protein